MTERVLESTKNGKGGLQRVTVRSGIDGPRKLRKGILVVSLDFELHWGVWDLMGVSPCREKLLAARAAIPNLLNLFVEYGIHATWATVGMMFCESKHDLLGSIPSILPAYTERELSPYHDIQTVGSDEQSDPFHYAPSLIRLIASTPHQEIGTHTFSHYYCLEDGQDLAAFRADLKAAVDAARRFGLELESLVFPRNQVNPRYFAVCAEFGIKAYRGNNAGWMYAPRQRKKETQIRRAFRLADCYLNLSGHNTYDPKDIGGDPANVPSSRLIWFCSPLLRPLDPLRLRRFRQEMMYAARHGRVYHLWLHPEDIGGRTDRSLDFLRRVFDIFAKARQEGQMESLNMRETAGLLSTIQTEATHAASGAGGLA